MQLTRNALLVLAGLSGSERLSVECFFVYFSIWGFLRSKGINFVSVDSNRKISASNRPPSSTDKAPYATLPFTIPGSAIARRPEQTSSPSKYPAMVTFSASIMPKALPSLKISKVREVMLPLKDPWIITLPATSSLPSRLDVSEMIVISSDLIRIFSSIRLVDYFSDSCSLQLMPCLWRYFSKLGVIRNFTVKKCSVMQHHSCEAYSYAKEFSLVGKVALI